MSDDGAENGQEGWPKWIRTLLKWLAILSALLVAFAGIKENWCKIFPCETACPTSLAPYNSGDMGGGHTQEEICEPQRQTYATQYPKCAISMHVSESNNKDALGHVTYRYACSYAASPK